MITYLLISNHLKNKNTKHLNLKSIKFKLKNPQFIKKTLRKTFIIHIFNIRLHY